MPDPGQVEKGQVENNLSVESTPDNTPVVDPVDYLSFSLKGDDGKEQSISFKTREEAEKAYRESHMMRSDYTRKTQNVAEEKRRLENDRSEMLRKLNDRDSMREKYEQLDKLFKERPDIAKQVAQQLQSQVPMSAQKENIEKLFEEKYGKDINEVKEWKQAQEAERLRSQTHEGMKKKYQDYNPDKVNESFGRLVTGSLEDLYDILYWHDKGQNSILKTEEKMAENFAKKQQAGLVPSDSVAGEPKGTVTKTIAEAKRKALEGVRRS